MSHTRCCYDLQLPIFAGRVVTGERFEYSLIGYDAVPAIIEARFTCAVPGAGSILVATGMWDGQKVRTGVANTATTFSPVAADINLGIESGFVMVMEQGVGRNLVVFNQLDVDITDLTISIRKKTSTVVNVDDVEGRK